MKKDKLKMNHTLTVKLGLDFEHASKYCYNTYLLNVF